MYKPMLNAESLDKVTRDVVKALSIVETLSEQVLGMVMVQQGVPVAELAPIMAWLKAHGYLRRPQSGQAYVTLGVNGHRLKRVLQERQVQASRTMIGIGSVGYASEAPTSVNGLPR